MSAPTSPQYVGPLTNKHLRFMAWGAFVAAIALAVWGVASDAVIMAFLTKAAADLGFVQARNVSEDIVEGKANAGGARDVEAGMDVSQI